jgi:hypothetical protein
MSAFDLHLFRDLAFGRSSLTEHPLQDETAVQKMVEALPAGALEGLAELAHWVSSIIADVTFSGGRRARVLMALDSATRPYWGELSRLYLAPDGKPAEGQDGDGALLRALLDCATAFAAGYRYSLEADKKHSRWTEKNFAHLGVRQARWLGRQFTLVNMLHLPNVDDVWEDLHLLHEQSEARQVFRKVIRVYPGKSLTSSIRQEYARIVLMDMAELETLRGREIELAFRISARVAANARLEPEPIPGAICAIETRGSSRPVAARLLHESNAAGLYLDAFNCLPRLKAMLERDMDVAPSDPDTMFGGEFTVRERNAMINAVLEQWGPKPPQRRHKRVALDTDALVKSGFANASALILPLEQANSSQAREAASQLEFTLANALVRKKAVRLKKALDEARVRVVDASIAGLGLLVPRKDAPWARVGILVCVYMEPGPDWVLGAVRRVCAEGESMRLGIVVYSRKPRAVWFRLEATGYASVWEEETRRERNFLEHYQCGILLDADHVPLGPGEMLLAPGIADRGSRLDLPFSRGVQRVRVTSVREATEDYSRVAFESMGVRLHAAEAH